MEQKTDRTALILEWRESLIKLPDYHFFELIRMYLGEVKTPYNKQKLIEELSAFLRKDENSNAIVKLLSETDILLLTGINTLQHPLQEKISRFFTTRFSFAELYERLLNLEERLIIFRRRVDNQMELAINPLLFARIEPFLNPALLLPSPAEKPCLTQDSYFPDELFLAAVFSFFSYERDVCKSDGTLKKRAEQHLNETFLCTKSARGMQFFLLVLEALKNLQLLVLQGADLIPDVQRWQSFADMDELSRLGYLCAASCGRFTRETLQKQAQLVLNIAASVPQTGYTRPVLLRCALLQEEKQNNIQPIKRSRLASLLHEQETPLASASSSAAVDLSAVISHMEGIGFLVNAEGVFLPNQTLSRFFAARSDTSGISAHPAVPAAQNLLTIDADFSVTLLPGSPLASLIPLMQFLHITVFDTVSRFEISRSSCKAAFDAGISSEQIMACLKSFTVHEISQSLRFSLEDWFHTYNSASLYKGYVLKAEKEKQNLIENNEILAPYIICTLAPGVYLFNFEDDEDASAVLKKCGLDFIGAVKTPNRERRLAPFSSLSAAAIELQQTEKKACTVTAAADRSSFFTEMYTELDKLNFPDEQAEGLRSRISRKIIINPVQLRPDSVRFEKIEAGGMDFLGKVHIVDHAISSDSMIELSYDDSGERILGTPLGIEKRSGDALIKLCVEPDKTIVLFSVSKASLIKRIRGSIFKENGSF